MDQGPPDRLGTTTLRQGTGQGEQWHDQQRPPQHGATTGNWWLRTTSYSFGRPQRTIDERERVRRSQLASWILLAFLLVDLLLIPIGLSDMPTLLAIAVVFAGLLVGVLLNRAGHIEAVAWLVVILVDVGIMGSLLSSDTGLTLDALPAYDLMLAAVVIAASLLKPLATTIVALGNIMVIAGDFFLQPHATDLAADLHSYPSAAVGVLSLLGRPIGLHLIITVVAILWVIGTDRAIRRADHAEEIATLEHAVAEQRRQLELGVRQLLETHVRLANGDFSARVPVMNQDNILWQVDISLNNLVGRFQRIAAADIHLQRAADTAQRLLAALRDAQAGRQPHWPAPSGTLVDPLLQFFTQASTGDNEASRGRDAYLPQNSMIDGSSRQQGSAFPALPSHTFEPDYPNRHSTLGEQQARGDGRESEWPQR